VEQVSKARRVRDLTDRVAGEIIPTDFLRAPLSANRHHAGWSHDYLNKSLTLADNLLILFDSRFLSTVDTPPAP